MFLCLSDKLPVLNGPSIITAFWQEIIRLLCCVNVISINISPPYSNYTETYLQTAKLCRTKLFGLKKVVTQSANIVQ